MKTPLDRSGVRSSIAATKAVRSAAQNHGGSLVESSLVLTVFLLFAFGTMDFGRLVYAYNFCSFAARDASRYAAVRGSSSGSAATSATVKTFVTGLAAGLDSTKLTVTTTWAPDDNPGSTVTVLVKYTYTPMVKMILPNALSVGSQSEATIMQ